MREYANDEIRYKIKVDHIGIHRQMKDLLRRLKQYRHGKSEAGWKEKVVHIFDAYDELKELFELIEKAKNDILNAAENEERRSINIGTFNS